MKGESAGWSHYQRRRTLKAVWELRRRANCARTHLINRTSLYALCSFNGGEWLQHPRQTTLSSLGCLRRYGREKRRSVKNQLRYIGNLASSLSRLAFCTRAQNTLERTPITPFVQTTVERLIIQEIYDWNQARKIHTEISTELETKETEWHNWDVRFTAPFKKPPKLHFLFVPERKLTHPYLFQVWTLWRILSPRIWFLWLCFCQMEVEYRFECSRISHK